MVEKAETLIDPASWVPTFLVADSADPGPVVAAVPSGSSCESVFAGNALRASSSSFCTSLTVSASRLHWSSGPSSARSSSTVCSSSGLFSVMPPLQLAV